MVATFLGQMADKIHVGKQKMDNYQCRSLKRVVDFSTNIRFCYCHLLFLISRILRFGNIIKVHFNYLYWKVKKGFILVNQKKSCQMSTEHLSIFYSLKYRGSPPYTHFGTQKKLCYMKFLLVRLQWVPMSHTSAKIPHFLGHKQKTVVCSGNRVSDFRISGRPPVQTRLDI